MIQKSSSKAIATESSSPCGLVNRRNFILSTVALAACGGSSNSSSPPTSAPPAPATPPPTTPAPAVVSPNALGVREFYRPEHGNNLQPAFQAAIDQAGSRGIREVVNDYGSENIEMWCPPRTSNFFDARTDGIPIVIRSPIHMNFSNCRIKLKGPGGGERKQTAILSPGEGRPWLGGWMYVLGNPEFTHVSIANVKVDGGFSGNYHTNTEANVSDKGFRVQDTHVSRITLRNVELMNFHGEIYYGGASNKAHQELTDCHFHGSPQCAFNPAGVGIVETRGLQAGRSYQAAEVLFGGGHRYIGGRFYDSRGASFMPGPAESFDHRYPYFYALPSAQGRVPSPGVFEETTFEKVSDVIMRPGVQGSIISRDASIAIVHGAGSLAETALTIQAWCDTLPLTNAVGIFGAENLTSQVPGAPNGEFWKVLSRVNLSVTCHRTPLAASRGYIFGSVYRVFPGLLDVNSCQFRGGGQARSLYEIFSSPPAGFELPSFIESPALTTA